MFNLIRLLDMLTFKRPYKEGGNETTDQFVERFIAPVAQGVGMRIDRSGNIEVDLRKSPEDRTMFASHLDTMHSEEGRQEIIYDGMARVIRAKEDCLGADDTAGIALMLHLMEAGVAGLYVFFVGEEVGCVGSRAYVEENKHWIPTEIDKVISFDRRGVYSVITHQMGARCCSEEFAEALSQGLTTDELMFCPDDTGAYTDSAQFMDIVPECTNISVGYFNEHTAAETLNVEFLSKLAEALEGVDFNALPVSRDPSVVEFWGLDLPCDYDPHLEDFVEALDIAMAGGVEWLSEFIAVIMEEYYGEDFEDVYESSMEYAWSTQELEEVFKSLADRSTKDVIKDVMDQKVWG